MSLYKTQTIYNEFIIVVPLCVMLNMLSIFFLLYYLNSVYIIM